MDDGAVDVVLAVGMVSFAQFLELDLHSLFKTAAILHVLPGISRGRTGTVRVGGAICVKRRSYYL